MKILCVGMNHRSAPLELRQCLAFDRQQTQRALALLKTQFEASEFVILSTCNRVEVYAARPADQRPSESDLVDQLAAIHQVDRGQLDGATYCLENEAAVDHLLTVASSLDSMVVGESQIIAQTKEAFLWAIDAEATGKYLNRLFHRAFGTAKRVHAATEIGRRRTSLAGVAVEFASRIFSDFRRKRVLVLGAGEMAELAVTHLKADGVERVTVVNRSAERGGLLAERFAARFCPWEMLDDCLAESDIVISSVSAERPILERERMGNIHRRRQYANWMILDLGVPRNVDPAVDRLRNVYLYDVDRLGQVVSDNVELRQQEIDAAREIIADETRAFFDWFESRDVGPLVERLEARLHELGDEELERLFRRLPEEVTERQRQEISLATHRIVHKLLHHPIERLKEEAREDRAQMSMRVLRRLFQLDQMPARQGEDAEQGEDHQQGKEHQQQGATPAAFGGGEGVPDVAAESAENGDDDERPEGGVL